MIKWEIINDFPCKPAHLPVEAISWKLPWCPTPLARGSACEPSEALGTPASEMPRGPGAIHLVHPFLGAETGLHGRPPQKGSDDWGAHSVDRK